MKKQTLFGHILFWVIYMAIFTFVEGGYNNQFREALLIEVAYFPIRLMVVYINYFWLMPKQLLKGKTRNYILATILSVVLATIVQRCFSYFYMNDLIFPNWDQGTFWQAYKFLQAGMILTSPMIFLIGITVVYRLVESQRKLAEIGEERTKAELLYLKNQINPHFFFNTLNSLYGLALTKSNKTPTVVMKLSELMSYMLYDTQQNQTTLAKELNYIRNYIELEEVRFEGRFTCNLSVNGKIEDVMLPPMLLLPFVENAFKHGVNTSSDGAWISLQLTITNDQLLFQVENSVGTNQQPNHHKGGVGIENVKRRLELLFPERHTLDYGHTNEGYHVILSIQLKKP